MQGNAGIICNSYSPGPACMVTPVHLLGCFFNGDVTANEILTTTPRGRKNSRCLVPSPPLLHCSFEKKKKKEVGL